MQKTLTELKQLYPFIYLTPSETPWYTGSSLDKYSTYDHEQVSPWYNSYKDIGTIQWVDEKFECMGKEHTLRMPKLITEDKEALQKQEPSTTELFNTIVNLAKYKAISNDKIYVLWKHILASYEVYTHSYTHSGAAIIYFVKNKTKRETDTFTPTDSFFTLLQAKEMLDGKIRFRPYAVAGELSRITQDDINSDLNVYGNYTQTLRNIAHSESGFFKKTGLLLQGWQYKAKLSLARETVRVAARRMGKTFAAVDELRDFAFSEKRNDTKPTRCIFVGVNKQKNRSAKDYLRNQLKHLMDQGLVSEVASENRFYVYEQTGTLSSTKTKKGLKTKAYIDFVGAQDDDPGVGDYADFIVIDEAEKIPENVFDDFYALVTNERSRILMISTLNPRSEKTWFYNKLIEGEKEEMERISRGETVEFLVRQIYEKYNLNQYKSIEDFYARCAEYDDIVEEWKSTRSISATRFTGRENSRLSENQVKEAALKQKSNNYIKYLAEFECVFPDESGVFELGGSNLAKEELQNKKFPYLVFAYDPADNGEDNRPLHVYAFDEESTSKTYGQIILLDENKNLRGVIEKHIPDVMLWIQDMCQKWLDKPWLSNYFFVYDSKGVATLAHGIMMKSGIKISLRFQTFYGYNVDIEAGNDVGIITHNVGKQGLIEGLVQKLFENNRIRISSACTGTYKELELYSAYSEGKYIRYSAPKGKQDGNVSCLLSAVYFISEVLGKNTKIIKEQANRLKEQLAEMQQHHNSQLTDKEIHERTTARAKYELKKLEYSKRKKRLHFFGY